MALLRPGEQVMSANNIEEKSKRRRRSRSVEQTANEEVDNESLESDEDEGDDDTSRGLSNGKGRATPGRRNQLAVEEEERGNAITRPLYNFADYFVGVRDELRKVNWPTREELRRLATIVLIVTITTAIVLGIISFIFTEMFIIGLDQPIIFVVFFAAVAAGVFAYNRFNKNRGTISPF
jgi:preprotein translocase SecE subunit